LKGNLVTQQKAINLYHKWTYLDEIEQAITENVDSLAQELKISVTAIKIIRILGFLEGITDSILNSFCHSNHPEQVDNHARMKWTQSLIDNLDRWHAIYHVFLTEYASSSPTPHPKIM